MSNRIFAILAALMFVTGSFAACGEEDPAENQLENQQQNDNDGENDGEFECETHEECEQHEDFGEGFVCEEDTNTCVEDEEGNGDEEGM